MPTAKGSMLTSRLSHAKPSPDDGAFPAKPLSIHAPRPPRKHAMSEGLYTARRQAAGRIVWRSLADGAVIDVSPWSALTGLTTKQVSGWGWLDAIHEDDRERVKQLWNQAATNKTQFDLEYRVRRDDGSYRRLSVRVAPVWNAAGGIREWVNTAAGVTGSQRRGVALDDRGHERVAGMEYTGAPPASPLAGLLMVNRDGLLTSVNTRVVQALGKRREELVGRHVRELFPEALALPFYREYERVLAGGAPAMFEAFYPPLKMWLETQIYPTVDGVVAYVSQSASHSALSPLEKELAQSLTREQTAHAEAETTARRLRQLQEMTDIALSHDHDTAAEMVFPSLLERICAFMLAPSAAILLFAEDGLSLAFHAGCGAFEESDARISLGQGVARHIAASHQPLIATDIFDRESVNPRARDQAHSIAGAPLLVEGGSIGALLVGVAAPRTFTEPDLQLLKQLSTQIAPLIARVQPHKLASDGYAEAEARASELTAALAAMTDGVFVTDRYGRNGRSNQAFRTLLALERLPNDAGILPHEWGAFLDARDALGMPVPPEDMPSARILGGEVLQGPTAMDLTLRALDGRIVEVNVTGAPVRTTEGGIVGAVAVYRDVTKRRRLERQVAEQARHLEGAFDAMTDPVVVFDSAGTILRNNAADRAIFGFDMAGAHSPQSLSERGQQLMLRDEHGKLLPQHEWPAFRVLRGEDLRGSGAVEIKARTLNGREVELSESGAPMYDESGQIAGGVMAIRDVTERRKLEHRTQEALEALLSMAEALVSPAAANGVSSSADVSAVIGRLGELTRSILGCMRMSLMALEPATDRLNPMLRHGWPSEVEQQWNAQKENPRLQDFIPEALIERLRAGEVVVYDASSSAPSGWQVPGVNIVLLAPLRVESHLIGLLSLDYGGQPHEYTADECHMAGAVAQFATIVIERERLLREREAACASEMASREATRRMELFMAMASHEFRTPLTVIKRYTELTEHYLDTTQHGTNLAEPGAKAFQLALMALAQVNHAAGQMTGLLNDLLQVSRAQVGKLPIHPQPCDLISAVRACVSERQRMTPTRQVRLRLPKRRQAPVIADPERIEQVVTNYLTNAFKYAPESQPIDVRIQIHRGTARVSVSDRGPGLSPINQERVWERFYQVEDVARQTGAGDSLGLGLYICRMIVEQHGGRVGVDSLAGSGSTFWFTLPLFTEGTERP